MNNQIKKKEDNQNQKNFRNEQSNPKNFRRASLSVYVVYPDLVRKSTGQKSFRNAVCVGSVSGKPCVPGSKSPHRSRDVGKLGPPQPTRQNNGRTLLKISKAPEAIMNIYH